MARTNPSEHRSVRSGFDELAAAEVFLQVAKTKSFTIAAKTLGKSTSSLSRIVSELERQLGAQVLARTTRRLSLTEAGTLYLTHAEGLLAARTAARDAVAELTGGVPRGHLRVSMPVSVGERLIGPYMPELRRRYPELRLELELSDRNVPLVQGGFDLAIRVGKLADSSLRAQLLAKVPVRLVASPAYLARHGAPAHPRELPDHDCITVGAVAGPVEWALYRARGRRRVERVEIDGIVHTTSPTLAAQLAQSGAGIMRAIEWVIREPLRRGELVEIMRDWTFDDPIDGGVPVWAVYAQTAGVAPPLKSRVFVELVKEIIAREDVPAKRPR
ncbi:MAG TPA: LysR family transcriptional regulator [Kofleriaceae bacterium]|nr:LysR family transcriptional regulator [Kofleriaceae bacterium]